MGDLDDLVVALAGHGLPGSVPWPDDEPLEPSRWSGLLVQVRSDRLLGLLAAGVADGTIPATEVQRAELAEAHEATMVRILTLEALLLAAGTALDAAGIAWRVVKGPASAHLLYPDPSWRTFVDLDLVVASADLPAAATALATVGAERVRPALRPDYDVRFAKGMTLRTSAGEIDLHRTLAPGPYGLAVVEADLFADARTFPLAGQDVPTVSAAVSLVHACYHAVLGDVRPTAITLRDAAALAADPALDHDEVLRLAARWRGRAVVSAALGLAAPLTPDADWPLRTALGADPPSWRDRLMLDSYRRRRGRFGRQAVASLLVLPGWRDRAAYARAVSWPSTDSLAARGLTRSQHLRRMITRR